MLNKKNLLIIELIACVVLILLFSYFRLKPMLMESVGYTYDQGRDFSKAAEIIVSKNPPFIGPTTGIGGVYHGAWWYYLLAIGFMLFSGLPIGFYYFNFFIMAISFIIFYLFLRKNFGLLPALIVSFLVTTAPQLIFDTIFIANNVMAMPAFMLVIMTTYAVLNKEYSFGLYKNLRIPTHLLAGLAIGFTAEFEFAFGLLLIPAYFLLLAFTWKWIPYFSKWKQILYFMIGLFLPFIPRFLFELKNNFIQTRTLFSFVLEPKYHTPQPYMNIFQERVKLFGHYYESIFMNQTVQIGLTILLIISALYIVYKKVLNTKIIFFFLLGILLFFFSTLYKDTFWFYYFDGIQYLFFVLIALILSTVFTLDKKNHYATFSLIILLTLFFLGGKKVYADINSKYVYDGIRVQKDIVNYIHEESGKNPTCVRVYTPPVIPHTYNYLFTYKNYSEGYPIPTEKWQNDTCWYILEWDDYKERKQAWIEAHLPKEAKRVSTKRIKDVDIQLWSL